MKHFNYLAFSLTSIVLGFNSLNLISPKTDICLEKVIDILLSAPTYQYYITHLEKAQKSNPTLNYSIEILNNPKSEGNNDNYSFRINEKHPEYNHSLAWFQFDPQKGKLYEYNIAQDSLIEISYDSHYLQTFQKACK